MWAPTWGQYVLVIQTTASAPHVLEVVYWILGGAGLFLLGVTTLVLSAGARGIPMLRSNTLHRHVAAAASEPCDSKIDEPTPGVTWSVWVEVVNLGRGYLIVDGGGLVTPKDEVMTIGVPAWIVNGATRPEPFTLAPGEIARCDYELPTDRSTWTGSVRVYVTVRRMFGWSMRRAQMTRIPGAGSTRRFRFVQDPASLVAKV